ncbi:hypothetical protein FB554_3328 [Barrientosiimonas humi]|uniref:Uncharacterized protein n=2 Tax=Barrientosiimonas TaxID=1535207 RepID=A0A542WZK7_9MICO|nr:MULTISPECIES: hypothetical protein [Barrientosiimonas]TQL29015.1 hypothetical protein FB554_3328 [Barrientosiimonas humi]BDZ56479.1 hypothetical protein GCM10025872_01360 [Barrientosiimonas endolithica]CAG7571490.1 hypothetical protein BH39T_PBIAJDOK_00396 [Barrientosiimonas humi]
MARVRQFVPWVIAAFLVYAVITSPDKSADTVRNLWDILAQGVRNIGQFFGNLMGS